MLTVQEAAVVLFCLEEFLYGKISTLCALTCTLAKEVQLSPGLGIYSGVFAIYSSKESRTATIVFYVLCFLYVLSTLAVISLSDLLSFIIAVSNNSIRTNIIFYADPYQYTQAIASTSN